MAIIGAFGFLLAPYIEIAEWWELVASVDLFDRFLVDILSVALVGIWLINLPGMLRVTGYVWFGGFIVSYVFQFLSVFVSGQFVSQLAIDNANHIGLLLDSRALVPFLVVLLLIVGLVMTIEKKYSGSATFKSLVVTSLVILIFGVAIQHAEKWLPQQAIAYSDSFFRHKDNYMVHKSPMKSLYMVLYSDPSSKAKPLNDGDIARAGSYGITISPDQKYPLIKDWIYQQPLPFNSKSGADKLPNIIVFFAEGLAARTINPYSPTFENLTPNMVDFARYAMKVNNYYNHTFATYRGLHGELCSIYPTHGGIGGWHTNYSNMKNVSYYCLSDILNEEGYRTLFLDTHRADAAFVDEMMLQLNFDQVITAEDVSKLYLGGDQPMREDALSDNQLATGLVGVLTGLEGLSEKDQPFFIGIYNLQTHVWQKISKDGTMYADGSNYILNTIHNYDTAFGEFWNYFKESSLFDNTIVILTTDHTHFPDRDYIKLVGNDPDYVPVFVDRIPLIVYHPTKHLPREFDASNASSIDFTPSLIHLLGLKNRPNPFLGRSIFDSAEQHGKVNGRSIAAAGDEKFLIDDSGVHKMGHKSAASKLQQQELGFIDNLMSNIWQLEKHNRIWPPKYAASANQSEVSKSGK